MQSYSRAVSGQATSTSSIPPAPLLREQARVLPFQSCAQRDLQASRRGVFCQALHVAAAATEEISEFSARPEDDEEIPGRDQWYIARFVADDAPDFNPGRYLRTEAAGPTLRNVVFEAEVSRERVPLRSAYKNVGQRAAVRINNGPTRELTEVHLLLGPKEAEEVYNAAEGDVVEFGPFVGTGMDLRALQSIYMYPTLVIFASGKGIATAKALVEAVSDANGLDLPFRQSVRLYYRAPNEDSLLFKDKYETWEEVHNCKVITGTRDGFMDLFDEDDTLEYEPASTAALIVTGGDEDAEAEALEVCKEAEITTITRDSVEQKATEFLAQQGRQI